MSIRLRAPFPARWMRLLLALTAVPAILAGLLAMHVLSGSGGESSTAGHHAMAFVESADLGAAVVDSHHQESSAMVCGPECEHEHEVSAVACVLALLVAAFALAIATGWLRLGWLLRPVRSLSVLTLTPADPSPPSLVALSISRT